MSDEFTIGGISPGSMDCDANGEYLYLAVLNDSGDPQILKMSTALDTDAEVDYDPGAGNLIQVVCGDYNAGIVWAAGNFGTDFVVQHNDETGDYWVSVDDPTWTSVGYIQPLIVGPGNDLLVTVTAPYWDILYENYFVGESGPYWTVLGENLPFDVFSMARLDYDLTQIIIGVDDSDAYWYPPLYWYPVVEFSPNNGVHFSDVSQDVLPRTTVTSLVFL